MAYRVRSRVEVVASESTDEEIVGFRRRGDSAEVTRTDPTEMVAESRQVADGTTDQALNFGGVASAKLFYLETDQTITIKLNGSDDAITIAPQTAGAKARFFLEGTVTAATISNASGNTATVTYAVAGS